MGNRQLIEPQAQRTSDPFAVTTRATLSTRKCSASVPRLGVPMRTKKSSLTAMLAAVLSSAAAFAQTKSDAPPGYFGATTYDVRICHLKALLPRPSTRLAART